MTDTTKIAQDLTDKIGDLNKKISDFTVSAASAQSQADTNTASAVSVTALRDQYQDLLDSLGGQ